MDEAAECADLLLMRDGAILAATTPDDLLARTRRRDAPPPDPVGTHTIRAVFPDVKPAR